MQLTSVVLCTSASHNLGDNAKSDPAIADNIVAGFSGINFATDRIFPEQEGNGGNGQRNENDTFLIFTFGILKNLLAAVIAKFLSIIGLIYSIIGRE